VDDEAWGMVCPFLDRSTAYAHGVEFGILYERMKNEDAIDDIFTIENQEQINLCASRLGWHVETSEALPDVEDWFRLVMRRDNP